MNERERKSENVTTLPLSSTPLDVSFAWSLSHHPQLKHTIVCQASLMITSFSCLSLFIFLTNLRPLCCNFPTLHHHPYLSFISLIQWFRVIVYSIFSWLVNHHMSWPLLVYRVVTIVRFAPQLCNLRTLLRPSQSSVLLWTSRLSISRAPSIWFTLLHLCLSLESSITLLGFAPSLAQPRIAFIALSTRSMEDTQQKQDP